MITLNLYIDADSAEYRSLAAFLHSKKIVFERQPVLPQAGVSGPLTPCDYRNPECSSTGKVVDGAWICSNHRRQ